MAMSFEELDTMCSAMPKGSGSAFGNRYGLLERTSFHELKKSSEDNALVADFSQLH